MRVRRVSVRLDGKPVRVRRGKRRMTAVVDLRRHAPGVALVRIRVAGKRHGKRARSTHTRAFVVC
jgi:hypothetical protein